MNLFGYLTWILIIGLSLFVLIRLKWIYEVKPHHLFWKKPQARHYFLSAALLLLAASFVLLLQLPPVYLIPLLLGFYVLCASAAVKVSERGVLSNGFLAGWLEIIKVQRISEKNLFLVKTTNPWRQFRLEVPPELEPKLRKIFASKRIAWLEQPPGDTAIAEPESKPKPATA